MAISNEYQFPTKKRPPVGVEATAVEKLRDPEPDGIADHTVVPLPAQTAQPAQVFYPMLMVGQALMFFAGNGRVGGPVSSGHDDGKRARAALNCLILAGVFVVLFCLGFLPSLNLFFFG